MNAPDTYRIIFSPASWKNLMKFPERLQDSILDNIYTLEENSRPSGCKKLKGKDGLYRVRIGDYRVVYSIEDDVLIVVVVKVADRKEGYD